MKLSELGEFGFIERIRRAVPGGAGIVAGIGDDCAVTTLPAGEVLLTTTDLLIEGVHFRRDWTDLFLLGRKSVSVNVSDIAAMGGTPRHITLGLGIPLDLSVEELERFVAGFLDAAGEYRTVLVGGDTCRSPGPLFISVTVEGSASPAQVVRRSGARPDDDVYVSGTLGDSALALRLLSAGDVPPPELARRHHDPQARTALGRELAAAGLVTAMIDVSDGLCADLGHILEASGVGARVEVGVLPLSDSFRSAVAEVPELMELALAGGEDYELLFTVPSGRAAEVTLAASRAGVAVTRIGALDAALQGLWLHQKDGRLARPALSGFNHFARR